MMDGKYDLKREKPDHFICKDCLFGFKAFQNAKHCPYCGGYALFNVSFEERMGTI